MKKKHRETNLNALFYRLNSFITHFPEVSFFLQFLENFKYFLNIVRVIWLPRQNQQKFIFYY